MPNLHDCALGLFSNTTWLSLPTVSLPCAGRGCCLLLVSPAWLLMMRKAADQANDPPHPRPDAEKTSADLCLRIDRGDQSAMRSGWIVIALLVFVEHDLRANASRLSRRETATHFFGSCASRRPP
jgi:hypothetical protein